MAVIRIFNTVEPVVSVFRLLGEGLRAAGHDVEIVTTTFDYRDSGRPLSEWAQENGVRILGPPGIGRYPRTWPGKAVLSTYYAVFAFFYALSCRRSTVNVFFTQPPFFHVIGAVLRLFRRQNYVCVLMDLYPDILTATGRLSPSNPVSRSLSYLSRIGFSNAARIVTIGRCMSDRLVKKGVDENKLVLIRNWPEAWVLNSSLDTSTRKVELRRLGLDDKFVCLYAGNIGVAHSTEELAEAAAVLSTDPRVHFLFISEGTRADALRELLSATGTANTTWLSYQPQEVVARIMSEVDLHFVTQRDGFEGIVVPSKSYSALAAGRPILYVGHPSGEIARMIEEEAIGWVVPPGNAALVVDTCRYLLDNRNVWQEVVDRITLNAQVRHAAKGAQEKYVAVINALVSNDYPAK